VLYGFGQYIWISPKENSLVISEANLCGANI